MREVAERRQQLELEHEQALAILKFKQDEIKRLQRVGRTLLLLSLYQKATNCTLLVWIMVGLGGMRTWIVARLTKHLLYHVFSA